MEGGDRASTAGLILTAVGVAFALATFALVTSYHWLVDALLLLGALAVLVLLSVVMQRARKDAAPPEQGPTALFSLRLPERPRTGHIYSHKTVLFEKALVTKHEASARALRFGLSMPGKEFLHFGDFQEIWRERACDGSFWNDWVADQP